MNREETARLLSGIENFDHRKRFNPLDVHTWHELLDDLPLQACKDAVVTHYKTSPYPIMAADIRTLVSQARVERARGLRTTRPDCGSPRCICDHLHCDLGWITVPEGSRKCPDCFAIPKSSTEGGQTDHPLRKEPA